ncbi:MAG: rRNA maturation RNase YbeY [Candidatus Omnitrophota bacterium]|nr:MAG: rRNA maturation RNase YbeY [Candidatus Omnitrophota bacterium]
MKIRIKNNQRKITINKKDIARIAEKILKIKGFENAELSILFTGKRNICALNKKFRNINRPTDVLAFSMREGEDAGLHPELLGDVVICPEIAQGEIYLCLVHGILHLLGFDDSTDKKHSIMKREQSRILRQVTQK